MPLIMHGRVFCWTPLHYGHCWSHSHYGHIHGHQGRHYSTEHLVTMDTARKLVITHHGHLWINDHHDHCWSNSHHGQSLLTNGHTELCWLHTVVFMKIVENMVVLAKSMVATTDNWIIKNNFYRARGPVSTWVLLSLGRMTNTEYIMCK